MIASLEDEEPVAVKILAAVEAMMGMNAAPAFGGLAMQYVPALAEPVALSLVERQVSAFGQVRRRVV